MNVQQPDPPVTSESIAAAKTAALHELRDAAVTLAAQRGHRLGTWHELGDDDCEAAYCRNCWKGAVVDVVRDPHLAGPALSQDCTRPDVFLANQHEADVAAAIEGAAGRFFPALERGK